MMNYSKMTKPTGVKETLFPSNNLDYTPELYNQPNRQELFNCLAYALNEPRLGMSWISGVGHTTEEAIAIENSPNFWKDLCCCYIYQMIGLEPVSFEQVDWDNDHIVIFYSNGHILAHAARYDHVTQHLSHKFSRGPVSDLDINGKRVPREAITNSKFTSWDGTSMVYYNCMARVPKKGIPIIPKVVI